MTLRCAMHKPTTAEVQEYEFGGNLCGTVTFSDGSQEIDIYTTPAAAKAVADAFNAAMNGTIEGKDMDREMTRNGRDLGDAMRAAMGDV